MGNNFEQDFIKNVQTNTVQANSLKYSKTSNGNKNIVIIIMALVILVEAIAIIMLAFLLKSYYEEYIIGPGEDIVDYTYNDDGSIRTLSLTCESENDSYILYPTGDYERWTFDFGEQLDTGTYAIIEQSNILLNSENYGNKKLDFRNHNIIDGNLTYVCDKDAIYETTE